MTNIRAQTTIKISETVKFKKSFIVHIYILPSPNDFTSEETLFSQDLLPGGDVQPSKKARTIAQMLSLTDDGQANKVETLGRVGYGLNFCQHRSTSPFGSILLVMILFLKVVCTVIPINKEVKY